MLATPGLPLVRCCLQRANPSLTFTWCALAGCICNVTRHLVRRCTLQNALPGAVIAEASAYSTRYHCDAVAAEESVVAGLPKARFLSALADEPALAESWSALLARSVQAARLRSEIRSLPRVADRLDAWLAEGNALPEKGRWQEMAAELGVTREALYRELSRRRTNNQSL